MSPRARRSVAEVTHLLALHDMLLADGARNRAFTRALAAQVGPRSRVLDIGAGTGVWAVTAARLGARRVVAVEKDPTLAPVIARLARENGVADRVEVVTGDARRLSLPRVFDVLVTETVGHQAFEEGIVALVAHAREAFLRPGAAIVPRGLALQAAPAALPGPAGLILKTRTVSELAVHVPRVLRSGPLPTLAAVVDLVRVDLSTVTPPVALSGLRGRWRLRDGGRVGCVAVWVRMAVGPGISLSTREGTHWNPLLLPLDPLGPGPGVLELEADLRPRSVGWRITWRGRGAPLHAAYSPLFAYGSLRL